MQKWFWTFPRALWKQSQQKRSPTHFHRQQRSSWTLCHPSTSHSCTYTWITLSNIKITFNYWWLTIDVMVTQEQWGQCHPLHVDSASNGGRCPRPGPSFRCLVITCIELSGLSCWIQFWWWLIIITNTITKITKITKITIMSNKKLKTSISHSVCSFFIGSLILITDILILADSCSFLLILSNSSWFYLILADSLWL